MTVPMPWSPSITSPRGTQRIAIVTIVLLSAIAGVTLGHAAGPTAVTQAGPELVRLMRFMAALKALLALVAAAAVTWRLGAPAGAGRFTAYAIATTAMAAGPGLIWGMAHIVAGSILLHAGLLATVLLLWRDPGTAPWLEALVAARRLRRLQAQAQGRIL